MIACVHSYLGCAVVDDVIYATTENEMNNCDGRSLSIGKYRICSFSFGEEGC